MWKGCIAPHRTNLLEQGCIKGRSELLEPQATVKPVVARCRKQLLRLPGVTFIFLR